MCRTLIKTTDYLDVFARFKQKENIEAVERVLATRAELDLFERAQLGMCSCLRMGMGMWANSLGLGV